MSLRAHLVIDQRNRGTMPTITIVMKWRLNLKREAIKTLRYSYLTRLDRSLARGGDKFRSRLLRVLITLLPRLHLGLIIRELRQEVALVKGSNSYISVRESHHPRTTVEAEVWPHFMLCIRHPRLRMKEGLI